MLLESILIAAALAPTPSWATDGPWTFVDEEARDGRNVLSFRSIVLRSEPAQPVDTEDLSDEDVSYALVLIGPSPDTART